MLLYFRRAAARRVSKGGACPRWQSPEAEPLVAQTTLASFSAGARNSPVKKTESGVRNATAFRGAANKTAAPSNCFECNNPPKTSQCDVLAEHSMSGENSPLDCFHGLINPTGRGRPLLQGVPSSKTVHRTVFEFTPCGAPS